MDSNMDNSQNSWNTADQGMSSGSDFGGYQNSGYGNTQYQDSGYQAGGFQNSGYQGDGYQNSGYQGDGYQNSSFQGGYQNGGYQNNSYQNNGYAGGYQNNSYPGGYGSYQNPGSNPYMSNDTSAQPVSVGEWIVTFILMIIPVVNLIMLLVWAFSSGTNPSKKNWAKAELIIILVCIAISIILSVIFGASIVQLANELQRSGYRY